MRGGRRDDHARLADLHRSEPVYDRHPADRPLFPGVIADSSKLFFRHFRVGFVVERDNPPTFVIIAGGADKRDDRARLRIGDVPHELV